MHNASLLQRLKLIVCTTCLIGLGTAPLAACTRGIRQNPEQPLPAAIKSIAADIANQLGRTQGKRILVIDPFLDGRTGQQIRASERVQSELAPQIPQFAELRPFSSSAASDANLVLSGTLTALPAPDHYRISVALSDRDTGLVIAQSAAGFRETGLDLTPTKFYGDSPSLVRDRSTEGYLKTVETKRGEQADPLYIEQIPTAALLSEALNAYNAERWEEALNSYRSAAERRDGQQLRTFNGIYLCNVQLGRTADAEQAFNKLVQLGLATNNLAVKLLFRPGTTDFWPDSKVSGSYPMWLREIATAADAAGSCMNIVGHTSHSGSEAINDRLSLARAEHIRESLTRAAPKLAPRMHTHGVGFRENIVGTGRDDASDALDRRVEFRITACGPAMPQPPAAPQP
jgi:outer membrane protein OmpA-like peptidoglycan-associated protein